MLEMVNYEEERGEFFLPLLTSHAWETVFLQSHSHMTRNRQAQCLPEDVLQTFTSLCFCLCYNGQMREDSERPPKREEEVFSRVLEVMSTVHA